MERLLYKGIMMTAIKKTTQILHTESPKRALLKYLGGKWKITNWVISHFPEHRIYVEPFGGGASVLLKKPRSTIEVYNDLDEEIVGILRTVQDPLTCRELFRRLQRTAYSRREFELAFKHSDDPVIRAQRAIVRAYQSFHHGSLFNEKAKTFADAKHKTGNHSKSHEWATYPRSLASISKRLQGVVIECKSAFDVIKAQDTEDTLFFVDPPYLPETRSKVGYRHEMTKEDHIALLELLRGVKGMVILAGYPSHLYDEILHDWKRIEHPNRAQNSNRIRTEVLWISDHKKNT